MSFDAILDQLRCDVTGIEARQKRILRWGIALSLLAASGLFISIDSAPAELLKEALIVLLFIAGAVLLLDVLLSGDDLEAARYRVQAAEEEDRNVANALALAQSGAPFALFLRSFDAEQMGLSSHGVQLGNISRGLENLRNARHGLFPVTDDIGHLEANWSWKDQLAVLHLLRSRAATILLGNTRLHPDMRVELARTGISELTIQVGNWWDVFLALACRPQLIVFYIEQATPMLMREMVHTRDRCNPYVVMGEPEELSRLAQVPEIGEGFLAGAKQICGRKDLANLTPLLDQFLGPSDRVRILPASH